MKTRRLMGQSTSQGLVESASIQSESNMATPTKSQTSRRRSVRLRSSPQSNSANSEQENNSPKVLNNQVAEDSQQPNATEQTPSKKYQLRSQAVESEARTPQHRRTASLKQIPGRAQSLQSSTVLTPGKGGTYLTPVRKFGLAGSHSLNNNGEDSANVEETPRSKAIRRQCVIDAFMKRLMDHVETSDESEEGLSDNDDWESPVKRESLPHDGVNDQFDSLAQTPSKPSSKKQKQSQSSSAQVQFIETDQESDEEDAAYFNVLNRMRSSKTSDNTLADLPQLNVENISTLLSEMEIQNHDLKLKLEQQHRNKFTQWRFELDYGFNLMFYGLGDKTNLVKEFVKTLLNGLVIEMDGLSSQLSLREVLISTLKFIKPKSNPVGNVTDLSHILVEVLKEPMYLVVHHLDGPSLRNQSFYESLQILCQSQFVHLMCSVDHLHFAQLLDEKQVNALNLIFHDLTTFTHYDFENLLAQNVNKSSQQEIISIGMDGVLQSSHQQQKMDIRRVMFVLDSLVENAKKILILLVEHQLQELALDDIAVFADSGLTFQNYFNKCRDKFLTSTTTSFRNLLTELTDHDVVVVGDNSDGVQCYFVPCDKDMLLPILEQLKTLIK
ncbi:hypothetical protein MP228_010921 [Amoeboaphelidium protococcarum]|nr:hypothetical protein MP228_010921 [Amoeboaphelidium protococcarum]